MTAVVVTVVTRRWRRGGDGGVRVGLDGCGGDGGADGHLLGFLLGQRALMLADVDAGEDGACTPGWEVTMGGDAGFRSPSFMPWSAWRLCIILLGRLLCCNGGVLLLCVTTLGSYNVSGFVRSSASDVRTNMPTRIHCEVAMVVTTAGSPGRPCSIFEIVISPVKRPGKTSAIKRAFICRIR